MTLKCTLQLAICSSTSSDSCGSSAPQKSNSQTKNTTSKVPWRPHTMQCKMNKREMKDFNKHSEKNHFELVTPAISWPRNWVPETKQEALILNVCWTPESGALEGGLVTAVMKVHVDRRCQRATGFECCHLFGNFHSLDCYFFRTEGRKRR